MEYLISFENGSVGYLAHHGIKGMHWGEWNDETRRRRMGISNRRAQASKKADVNYKKARKQYSKSAEYGAKATRLRRKADRVENGVGLMRNANPEKADLMRSKASRLEDRADKSRIKAEKKSSKANRFDSKAQRLKAKEKELSQTSSDQRSSKKESEEAGSGMSWGSRAAVNDMVAAKKRGEKYSSSTFKAKQDLISAKENLKEYKSSTERSARKESKLQAKVDKARTKYVQKRELDNPGKSKLTDEQAGQLASRTAGRGAVKIIAGGNVLPAVQGALTGVSLGSILHGPAGLSAAALAAATNPVVMAGSTAVGLALMGKGAYDIYKADRVHAARTKGGVR